MPRLTERQFRQWEAYYEEEPWGEERADWRLLMSEKRWGAMLGGNEGRQIPKATWPYFEDGPSTLNPQEIAEGTANFADAIEPKEGGGYQWKPGRGPQGMNTDGDEHDRQT